MVATTVAKLTSTPRLYLNLLVVILYRRVGIGFDMKELDESKYENMSPLASSSTFGHLGFTGTCTFADPENQLVYVLLSNRTYPTMENNSFGRKNFRPRIQSAIYNSIIPTKTFIHQGAELDALIEE